MSSMRFHSRTGTMVTLSNFNRTARRSHPHQEFNNGVVMSSEPLQDDCIFEVRIDKKVPSWSGSIEIGVTSMDPATLEFPSSATDLREGSLVMSGTSVLQDGKSLIDEYGDDLDQLSEGDRVGVMRSSSGNLHFFINGVNQGVITAINLANVVYAIVDMYGKCAQVSIVDCENRSGFMDPLPVSDSLCFHERCGSMIKLSNKNCTAERRRPVDEFNNGVVITSRPLKDDELFEIRIDKLVHKWSRSIEMGITSHNPETLEFPDTMSNLRSGTIMMSGCGILTNGKGVKRVYGAFSLDELREGDRIGLMCKANGDLHYYINGSDQGVAAENVPSPSYGVVDLYGMTVKVTICCPVNEACSAPVVATPPSSLAINLSPSQDFTAVCHDEELLFHPRCGDHVAVVNGGRTALRPNCQDDFNNAVVLTERPLRPGEFFQVVLEHIVAKWAGSIEIGVTTHCAQDFDFPPTMTNIQSGTWMMTGNGIMYNGTTIIDEYGRSLDKLKAGDRVGLIVTPEGKLHFYVNGTDQGLAACNIPDKVYGVIDLYGQAAKASIVYSPGTTPSNEDLQVVPSSTYHRIYKRNHHLGAIPRRPMYLGKQEVNHINKSSKHAVTCEQDEVTNCFMDDNDCSSFYDKPRKKGPYPDFHSVYGVNVKMSTVNHTATRIADDHNGLLFSTKPIELEGYFQLQLYTINLDFAGTIAIGLTNFEPKHRETLPKTALNFVDCDSWILSAGHIYKNGQIYVKNYSFRYRDIRVGDKIALKKDDDGNLSYYINGEDLGVAVRHLPKNLYVVVDLYGQAECVQLQQVDLPPMPAICDISPELTSESRTLAFHKNHGKNIELSHSKRVARRIASYNHGVVMTNRSLKPDELFEVKLGSVSYQWTSTLRIGITRLKPEEWKSPMSSLDLHRYTWIFGQNSLFHNGEKVLSKYGPNFEDLQVNDKIGVKVNKLGELHLYVNDVDEGAAVDGIIFPCYGVVDLYGQCTQVMFSDVKNVETDNSNKENREKADIENGVKEKVGPVLTERQQSRDCEFKNRCVRVKLLLGLPDAYFVPDQIACYCDVCHKLRGDEPYFMKGDPPKEYAQPFGWCQFGIKMRSTEDDSVSEKWHNAFHGVKPGSVRRILDKGKLLPPDQLGLKIRIIESPSKKSAGEKETSLSHVLISPTLKYAGCSKFAPKADIFDPFTKTTIYFKVAFQVFVRPGSYTVGPQQLGAKQAIDSHFNNSDLEWYTKEEGSTVLQALLVRIEGCEIQPPAS